MKFPDDYINKVICGDCLEIMKDMPDKCVELVVTDIPFNVNFKYGVYDDNLSETEYCCNMEKWFSAIARVSLSTIIKIPTKFSYLVLPIFNKCIGYGWTVVQYSPNTTTHGAYNLSLFAQYIVSKNIIKRPNCDLFINTKNNISKLHPAEMPIRPMQIIIDWFSDETSVILDPFLGSGTTAVAAQRLGRKFIGIEINPDYCKIAEERLAQRELFNE